VRAERGGGRRGTPEEEAEALRKLEAIEREIENLRTDLASEEHSLHSTIDFSKPEV